MSFRFVAITLLAAYLLASTIEHFNSAAFNQLTEQLDRIRRR